MTKKRNPGERRSVPVRTAELATGGVEGLDSEEKIRGLICNPIYAGVGPYPRMVSDEVWIGAAAKLIREEGPEQFLVNMLYVLRRSFDALNGRDPRSESG
jgi:hypothetical protein